MTIRPNSMKCRKYHQVLIDYCTNSKFFFCFIFCIINTLSREFEKVRCEKRLLEDKYKSLKEKYLRLKNEVRLSMERKRQAKLNRQLQQREPASTTEDTERSTDHGKPPLTRR